MPTTPSESARVADWKSLATRQSESSDGRWRRRNPRRYGVEPKSYWLVLSRQSRIWSSFVKFVRSKFLKKSATTIRNGCSAKSPRDGTMRYRRAKPEKLKRDCRSPREPSCLANRPNSNLDDRRGNEKAPLSSPKVGL